MIKKHLNLLSIALLVSFASFTFTACDQSEIKGDNESKIEGSEYHGQDINPNDPALNPERDTTTGTSGGMNQMDPEGSSTGSMDNREDSMNSGK